MITKETFLEKMEAQLKVWGERIEHLKTKIMTAQGNARTEYQDQLSELGQRQTELEQKLQALKQAPGDKWDALKIGVEQALTAMEESFDRAKEKAAQSGELGWTEGMTEKSEVDSEGWVEGTGHRTGHSEGWVEGMGEQSEDSEGWTEGVEEDKK